MLKCPCPRPYSSRLAIISLLLVPSIALIAPAARAQSNLGTLTVLVYAADTGQPLTGALVSTAAGGFLGITGSDGVLRLTELPAGAHTLSARFLGYAPGSADVWIDGGSRLLRLALEVRPLELAEVRVHPEPSLLDLTGFNDRKRTGFGVYITREDILRMQPRALSDVLRRVAGLSLSAGRGGAMHATFRGTQVLSGDCPVQYFVDGVMASHFNADEMRPADVAGLEIYRGAASIPPMYNKGTALCGVVVIWTRDR